MNILTLLTDDHTLAPEDATAIASEAQTTQTPIEAILERRGITQEAILTSASKKYDMPHRILPTAGVGKDALAYIPEESAKHYGFAPIGIDGGALEVGITDPDNIEALDALQFIAGKVGLPYKLFIISQADFNRVMDEYGSLTGEVSEALSELEPPEEDLGDGKQGPQETIIKEDAPVTKIVATILRYAVEGGASDIHIEPSPEKTQVRFRMDGELHTSLELPAKVHAAVVARIKILSQMRLDERRKPQDGRFSATVEGRRIDFRVSTFPTQFGEKVVMRILDRSKSVATLESLGFSESDTKSIRSILARPYGIVLISGPTGSGKSTTLFAMLSALDREAANVVSLEDPVEYEIPGVSQSQVRPEIGYTFASGLRSILRQDPDIIMVGEIRDKETAQLAIQAALTGHLVFSTIHTNTAAGVIPRLVDMGVDPYLIAPTLIAAIGQRLVRKLCPGAGKEVPISDSLRRHLEDGFADLPKNVRDTLPEMKSFYEATTTPDCPNGTRGREAVFEIMMMDPDMEKVILKNPVEEEVYAAARAKGMFTMREDAIMKALAGEIPFQEIDTLGGALLADDEAPISEETGTEESAV
ncbi:MAG TPA: GspE/PulE family protein [Candidatus Paceibacterota bacterium]|nr:GspE/PulE family protein [Candidatus Paceibacterota bacterium]